MNHCLIEQLNKNVTDYILSFLDVHSHYRYSITSKFNKKKYYPIKKIIELIEKRQYVRNLINKYNDKYYDKEYNKIHKINTLEKYFSEINWGNKNAYYGDSYYCQICKKEGYFKKFIFLDEPTIGKVICYSRETNNYVIKEMEIKNPVICGNCSDSCMLCNKSHIKKSINCLVCNKCVCIECVNIAYSNGCFNCEKCKAAYDSQICSECRILTYNCNLCKKQKCLVCISYYNESCLKCKKNNNTL